MEDYGKRDDIFDGTEYIPGTGMKAPLRSRCVGWNDFYLEPGKLASLIGGFDSGRVCNREQFRSGG